MITVGRKLEDIKLLANLAYRYKLYELDGLLRKWYSYPINIEMIAVYRIGTQLVGAAVLLKHQELAADNFHVNFGVWVHPSVRRKGIGTKLVKAIQSRTTNEIYAFKSGYRNYFFEGVL